MTLRDDPPSSSLHLQTIGSGGSSCTYHGGFSLTDSSHVFGQVKDALIQVMTTHLGFSWRSLVDFGRGREENFTKGSDGKRWEMFK